jgi:hypothetical protein
VEFTHLLAWLACAPEARKPPAWRPEATIRRLVRFGHIAQINTEFMLKEQKSLFFYKPPNTFHE